MIIPVRCYTCGKVIGNKWEMYEKLKKENVQPNIIFEKLKIDRYCCKRILVSHVNMIDDIITYSLEDLKYVN